METTMYQHILAPIDGSLLSTGAVSQVVEFAFALGAKVTFFHAKPNYAATGAAALDRVVDVEKFRERLEGDGPAILAKAEAAARDAGIEFDSIVRVSDRPYQAILDAAEERGCDLIFMSSHGQRGFMGFALGSQTQNVLTHTRIPVLVASIERNSRAPELDRALAVYRDDHRSIAAVVHGMTRVMQESVENGVAPDFSLFEAMLHFVEAFPMVRHHPREERCLFPKLRGHDDGLDALIDKIEAQHLTEVRLIAEIRNALKAAEGGGADELLKLAKAVEDYAELTWGHMTLEDKVILGHAQRIFTQSDWKEVAESFAGNESPGVQGASGENFGSQLNQIISKLAVAAN
jgi:nucleotide-binding universal stress UspA family protein/hemerythrin-like domain-containing protein